MSSVPVQDQPQAIQFVACISVIESGKYVGNERGLTDENPDQCVPNQVDMLPDDFCDWVHLG